MAKRYDRRAHPVSDELAQRLAGHFRPGKIRPLGGGFSNANFQLGNCVLRCLTRGWDACRREAAVLRLGQAHGLAVPHLLDCRLLEGRAVLLLEYIEGGPLLSDESFGQLGQQLARVHSVAFEQPGHFASDGSLRPFPEDFGRRLLEEFLAGIAGQRLGRALCRRVAELVERCWPLARAYASRPCLVHGDLNPKNVLVDHEQVYLLDWEYAMAGDRLIDLGNFFRFESDYSPSQREAWLAGYESVAGPLPVGWREAARMHDLVSMLAMLDRDEESPTTFATARGVVEDTLARLAP